MPPIQITKFASHVYHGAATVGRLGTWPVRKAGAKMKTAPSGAARAAQTFHTRFAERYRNWADARDLRKQQKHAGEATDLLRSLRGPASSNALVFALVEEKMDFAVISGAIAGLQANFTDEGSKVASLKKALGKLDGQQREKLWNLELKAISEKLKKLQPQQREESAGTADDTWNSLGQALFEFQRDKLKSTRGTSLKSSDDGGVTGTFDDAFVHSSAARVHSSVAGNEPVNTAVSRTDFIQTRGRDRLDRARKNAGGNGAAGFKVVGNRQIVREAAGDLPRMDITLVLGGDNKFCTRGTSEKLEEIVDNLEKLAGSDKATTVLSSVLNQYDLRDIVRGCCRNGEDIVFRPLNGGFNDVRVYDSKGGYEVHKSQQIGGAKITVEKKENDFLVSVEWPYLAGALQKGMEAVSVDPRNPAYTPTTEDEKAVRCTALKVTLSGSFVISGDRAATGELEIVKGNFTHNISGAIQKPY